MAMSDEQGAARHLKKSVNEMLKSLHIDQQHLQQTAHALCSNSSFGRSQAMWVVTRQQTNLVQSANVLREDAQALMRVKQAHTLRLQYDQTAANKVLRCMQLEQRAQQLDSVTGSRQYNRLHPRYVLN